MSVKFLKEALTDGDLEDYGTVVYTTGWEDEGKWSSRSTIILVDERTAEEMNATSVEHLLETGYYLIVDSRSGSYFTDYEYEPSDVHSVDVYEELVPTLRWKIK